MTRTTRDWGEAAKRLPGWRWVPGMRILTEADPNASIVEGVVVCEDAAIWDFGDGWEPETIYRADWPDVDDPATGGCMLAMLADGGPIIYRLSILPLGVALTAETPSGNRVEAREETLGRVCTAIAEGWGCWPDKQPTGEA